MKTIKEHIATITPNKANLEYCSEVGRLNGSIAVDIKRIMKAHTEEILREAAERAKKEYFHTQYHASVDKFFNSIIEDIE